MCTEEGGECAEEGGVYAEEEGVCAAERGVCAEEGGVCAEEGIMYAEEGIVSSRCPASTLGPKSRRAPIVKSNRGLSIHDKYSNIFSPSLNA